MLKTVFLIHICDIFVLCPNGTQITNCVPLGQRSVPLYAGVSFNSVQWYILLTVGWTADHSVPTGYKGTQVGCKMLTTLFFIHISDIFLLSPNVIQLTKCVPLGHRSVPLYA